VAEGADLSSYDVIWVQSDGATYSEGLMNGLEELQSLTGQTLFVKRSWISMEWTMLSARR
jgi:hypothetical protein